MDYVLIPLGNPGKEYEMTRHNAARVVLSHLDTEKMNVQVFIPDTYMNDSGKAIREFLKYKENLLPIVMYDDKDLPLGTFRVAYGRGDGGHNGLQSIIVSLQTRDFVRIRIGIAPKETDGKTVLAPHGKIVQDYVLKKMSSEEVGVLKDLSPKIGEAIEIILKDGYKKAMEKFN